MKNNIIRFATTLLYSTFLGQPIFAQVECPLCRQEISKANNSTPQKTTKEKDYPLLAPVISGANLGGFTPNCSWIGEGWVNAADSNNIKALFDTLIWTAFDVDISAITNSKGLGKFGISAFYYTQTSDGKLGKFASSQGDFSNILSGEMTRIFEIFYANGFETQFGNIGFRAGQLASDEDFMCIEYADVLLNSSFGALPNVAPVQLFSQYPVATLGIVSYYNIENFDISIGIYNGNVGNDVSSNNGFDYSHTFDTIAVWYQFGYKYSIWGLAGHAVCGGNYHSDPSKVNFDAIDTNNFYSFYFGVSQSFVNDCENKPLLGGFARVGVVPSQRASDNNFYADFGINWFAPIPDRKDDVFAAGFSIIQNERSAREDFAHFEATLEFTYKCQITPAIAIQPDFQIFFNPRNRDDSGAAYIVGIRAEVVF